MFLPAVVSWHKHAEAPFVRKQKATGERTTSAHILLCQHKQSQVCVSALSAGAVRRGVASGFLRIM